MLGIFTPDDRVVEPVPLAGHTSEWDADRPIDQLLLSSHEPSSCKD
jgi:hypothetical protein